MEEESYDPSMGKNKLNETEKALLVTSRAVGIISILFIAVAGILVSVIFSQGKNANEDQAASSESQPFPGQTAAETSKEGVNYWSAPVETSIPPDKSGEMIRYGKELIAHTSIFKKRI